jgi:hypothetical protein
MCKFAVGCATLIPILPVAVAPVDAFPNCVLKVPEPNKTLDFFENNTGQLTIWSPNPSNYQTCLTYVRAGFSEGGTNLSSQGIPLWNPQSAGGRWQRNYVIYNPYKH